MEGGVENNYVYPPDPVNNSDVSGQCLEDACIGESAILVTLALRYYPQFYEFVSAFVDNGIGGGGGSAKYLSAEEKAAFIKQLNRGNSVQIHGVNQIAHYDVAGAAHTNTVNGQKIKVPTPHVQVRGPNIAPNGRKFFNNKGDAVPMSASDFRVVIKYLDRVLGVGNGSW